ncbi:endo alpha-1,4 polygalactosaminidase [Dyadobacter psychrophilus]|uniref:Glycoside-hydrolase family GH114 TIM-barrel domain-containing protein n=1 Tax=Dyadobacter psychrophilus TaxID=651661 RepID=A0A1T5E3M2_9BACT|nr:endo alpha-1,4 polygalactosaminidase [Dyadobacter psychrophilus]SKB78578.1 cysteinyl-tRNA synthetase, unknown class [Dyadobacter psychrophilus]
MKFTLVTFFALLLVSCNNDDIGIEDENGRNFKQDMRDYVIGISKSAKAVNPDFAVIPQNGIELVTTNGEDDGGPSTAYLSAIDGNGQEDLFFGYENDDQATEPENSNYLRRLLDVSKNAGKKILVTDYTATASKIADSYQKNAAAGYVSYAATQRSLDVIPTSVPNNVNAGNITSLSQAKNFLYLINPERYATKAAFIDAVAATNYDAVIMDLFLNDEPFTAAEVEQLRVKSNGGSRLVICYMSIGEAEDYRYYWQETWAKNKPAWIAAENPDWPGNYKVKYWNEEWQGLIYKNQDSYLSKIVASGFDGVYLDIIDAFEYFED